jgi:hypothetical protein
MQVEVEQVVIQVLLEPAEQVAAEQVVVQPM